MWKPTVKQRRAISTPPSRISTRPQQTLNLTPSTPTNKILKSPPTPSTPTKKPLSRTSTTPSFPCPSILKKPSASLFPSRSLLLERPFPSSPPPIPKTKKQTRNRNYNPLPLHPPSRTYRGPALLGAKNVRSSPTFKRLIVDGTTYVLVPEGEHSSSASSTSYTRDGRKVDGLVERLRGIRNELFGEERDGRRRFNLAVRQLGIVIEVLREGRRLRGEEEESEDEIVCARPRLRG